MRTFWTILATWALALLASGLGAATAPGLQEPSGRVTAVHEGREIDLPLLQAGYEVQIEGDMATVVVTQRFANPGRIPLHAQYLFPLNQNAAVYAMQMIVGDERIEAVIQEKSQAEATFEQAKSEGKAAGLLTQHRPNMFTQTIANLMPGAEIEVRLRYVQMVPKVEGAYELVLPLLVGPRYEGAVDEGAAPEAEDTLALTDHIWAIADVPAYPQVAGLELPESFAADRVSLEVSLTAGLPLGAFSSATHDLEIIREGNGLQARFAQGQVQDNKDVVLRYSLGEEATSVAAISHTDARGGFVSVMIEPPELPQSDDIAARELVFVLDTSGSMSGLPMQASKRFMNAALDGLRQGDYFRVIPFSNTARHMAKEALPATPANIQAGKAFVSRLNGSGGTKIDSAIRTAFAARPLRGTMRIVVFLSDGYIGREDQVLRTIRNQIGAARIYAFGVGSSVNRYLLDGMAKEGRGYARYVGLGETAGEAADALARDLKTPVLTDIDIDWGDLNVTDVTPSRVPDLFAGGSVRVYARHNAKGPAKITIRGRVQGREAAMPVPLTLSSHAAEPALPLIWARTRIADMERNVAVGEQAQRSDAEITKLGRAFSLQTKNTSFVAVSQRVVNETGQGAEANVALPMVHGISPKAYPNAFAGSSTPEPAAYLGMLVMAALSLIGFRRKLVHN